MSEWDQAKSVAIETIMNAFENCGFEFERGGDRVIVVIPVMNGNHGYEVKIKTEVRVISSRRVVSDD